MNLLHEVSGQHIKEMKRYPYEAAFGGMDIKVYYFYEALATRVCEHKLLLIIIWGFS